MTSQTDEPKMLTLPERLRMKADMITMGERIEFGSECLIMHEAAEEIERLEAALPCPHVFTSKGGTSHCTLAASEIDRHLAEIDRLNRQVKVLYRCLLTISSMNEGSVAKPLIVIHGMTKDALAAADKIEKE